MTRRRADYPLQKVTFNAYEGDWDKLAKWYPESGSSRAARDIIRRHLNDLENKQERLPLVDIELEI